MCSWILDNKTISIKNDEKNIQVLLSFTDFFPQWNKKFAILFSHVSYYSYFYQKFFYLYYIYIYIN